MSEIIEIKNVQGDGCVNIQALDGAGTPQSWSNLLWGLSQSNNGTLHNHDFTGLIREQVSLNSISIEDCVFDLDEMQRSIFNNCTFKGVTLSQSSFHHVGDRSDRSDRSLGALFNQCKFIDCRMQGCDFVMSKFFKCEFDRCRIQHCDMRNVFWFERSDVAVAQWSELPDMGDPFKSCFLKKVTFGHPISNIMALPIQMMIPKSYASVWSHMSTLQRKMTRLSYLMSEESGEVFSSSV